MDVLAEENYKLDGSTSWVHCLKFNPNTAVDTPYHYHEYIEILYFYDGEGIIQVNGKSKKFQKNNLIVINSGRAHAIDLIKPTSYLCIKVMPNILYSNERFCDEYKYVFPFISETQNEYFFNENESNKLKADNLLTSIANEWESMNYGFELAIKSYLLEFFTRVLRFLHNQNVTSKTAGINPEIRKAIVYLTNNYATVSEKELADICHLSYNHFSYLFKKSVGKSYKDYLLDTKLREAEKLLLTTEKSITDIAQELNFSSSSHFITQFKKKKGSSPAKFRKSIYFQSK